MAYKEGDTCPCCGCKMSMEESKMATANDTESEGPEVEVSVEGDPMSVRKILDKLMPQ